MVSRTVLSVDDEPSIIALRQIILENTGYRVLNACDGKQALEMFRGNAVDLVLLDYYMPGMNGGEVAAEIKRLRPVPIIMVSGSFSLAAPELASVDFFIDKGAGPEAMLKEMHRLLPDDVSRAMPFAAA
jgi:CheY-like chemotaxis protein